MFRDAEHFNEDFYDGPFSRADFARSEFMNCNFYSCDFDRADFLGAIFTGCDFHQCKLSSYITGVRFENCSFRECSFDEAYIFSSEFKNCELVNGSMTDAMLATADFPGTSFNNVKWKDHYINKPPVLIQGIGNFVVALDNGHMQIGCRYGTYDWFWDCPDREVAAMEGLKSRRFWKKNKQWIFDMLKAQGLYDYASRTRT